MVALSLQKAGMLLKFTPFCYFDYIVPLNVYLRLCEIIYCLKDGRLNICVRGIPNMFGHGAVLFSCVMMYYCIRTRMAGALLPRQ